MTIDKIFIDSFAESTARAAYGASLFKGKNDKIAADKAAVDEMRKYLNTINMSGIIVIGEKPYAETLALLVVQQSRQKKLLPLFVNPSKE